MLTFWVLCVILWLQGEARIAADSATHGCCGTGVDAPILCVRGLVVSGGQVLKTLPLLSWVIGRQSEAGYSARTCTKCAYNFNKGERFPVSNNRSNLDV